MRLGRADSADRARRRSMLKRVRKLQLKTKQTGTYSVRRHDMEAEQREIVLTKTMPAEDLARVMKLTETRHGLVIKVETGISDAVDRVLSLAEALSEADLKEGLKNKVLQYLHGQAPSSPCAALYLKPGTRRTRGTPQKLGDILDCVQSIQDRLPPELLAAIGGLSLLVYVGGDVLRRMLKDSPARQGVIVSTSPPT